MTKEEYQDWVNAMATDFKNQVIELNVIIKDLTLRAEKAERERDFYLKQVTVFKPFDSVDEMKVERMLKVIK